MKTFFFLIASCNCSDMILKWICVLAASICDHPWGCWAGTFWTCAISSEELWHDLCFQRLPS